MEKQANFVFCFSSCDSQLETSDILYFAEVTIRIRTEVELPCLGFLRIISADVYAESQRAILDDVVERRCGVRIVVEKLFG